MKRRDFLATVATLARGASAQRPLPAPKKAVITSSVMLWTLKGSFEEKLEGAARAGVQSVELVGEYVAWSDAQIEHVNRTCRSFGLGIDSLVATPGWKRQGISMVDPSKRPGFLEDVRKAIVFARKLAVPQIVLMSGDEVSHLSREQQYDSLLECSKRAGEVAAEANLTALLEPRNNKVDAQGFYLSTCAEGLRLIKEVDNPHVRLMFDLYHEQVQSDSVIPAITEAAPLVSVFHVADSPGRHEPGTGEMDYPAIYRAIQKTGYGGYITMEYLPLGDPVKTLIRTVDEMRSVLGSSQSA